MTSDKNMRSAVYQVLVDGKKTASVARDMNIPRATLQRYVKKMNAIQLGTFKANFNHRQIVSKDDETELIIIIMYI